MPRSQRKRLDRSLRNLQLSIWKGIFEVANNLIIAQLGVHLRPYWAPQLLLIRGF